MAWTPDSTLPPPPAAAAAPRRTYSPAVERWRPIVEKYFPAELVDKALYVINGESGGNPTIPGDNGNAVGLFQIHHGGSIAGRPSADQLKDPEFNIKYAAQSLGAASGKWTDWGEGSLYNGKKFGALGNAPYDGSAGAGGPREIAGLSMTLDQYYLKFARWTAIDDKIQLYQTKGAEDPTAVAPTDQEFMEYLQLGRELDSYEAQYEEAGGDVDAVIKRADADYARRPDVIDAQNAADQFARDVDVRQQATSLAGAKMDDQRVRFTESAKGFNDFLSRGGPQVGLVPSTKQKTSAQLFDEARGEIEKGLPRVPGMPYPDQLPATASRPTLAQVQAGAVAQAGEPPVSESRPDVKFSLGNIPRWATLQPRPTNDPRTQAATALGVPPPVPDPRQRYSPAPLQPQTPGIIGSVMAKIREPLDDWRRNRRGAA